MNGWIIQAVEALRPLGARVVRGWPQDIVALPSLTVREADNRALPDGGTLQALELVVRAASPEQADALAAQADGALHMRRAACRDGTEKDGSCFLKHLRYERRLPAPQAASEEISLTLEGQPYAARLLHRERRRALHDLRTLADAAPRLAPGALARHSLRLAVPAQALPALENALGQGSRLTLPDGSTALIEELSQRGGQVEALLHITL